MIGEFRVAETHLKESIELAEKYRWNMSIPLMTSMIGGIEASRGKVDESYRLFFKAAVITDSLMKAQCERGIRSGCCQFRYAGC